MMMYGHDNEEDADNNDDDDAVRMPKQGSMQTSVRFHMTADRMVQTT